MNDPVIRISVAAAGTAGLNDSSQRPVNLGEPMPTPAPEALILIDEAVESATRVFTPDES